MRSESFSTMHQYGRAAVEGVPETVIAAIYLLHDNSVDAVASKLTPGELGHVIRLVGRCPSYYPPGTLDAGAAFRTGHHNATMARHVRYGVSVGRAASSASASNNRYYKNHV